MVAKAKRFVDAGYKAVKMQVGHIWTDAEDIANVRRVRDAVGPNIDIMVDVNMAWTADKAILMGRKLAEFDIYWLEEPVLPDDFHGYQRIAKALDLRVVGGESHFTRYDLRPFFEDPQYGGVWMNATPMKRPGEPEELGPLAVFLAAEASSFMTGAVVVIDGGYTVW